MEEMNGRNGIWCFFVLPEEMGENFLVLTGENAAHAKVAVEGGGSGYRLRRGGKGVRLHRQRCEPPVR